MRYIQVNATGTIPIGPFVSPTDGVTPVTNLVAGSLNGVLITNGNTLAYVPSTLTYDTNGHYFASTPTGLSNLGNSRISFSNPSLFAPVWDDLSVLSPNVYASIFGNQSLVPSASGSGSDPWAVNIPGTYIAGQAGFIVGTNLNTTVSSRSTYAGGPVASVTAPVTITQSFPANFASLGINASGTINRVTLTDLATSITNPVVLPTIPPSGYGGSDPWLTSLPGSYTGSEAGAILGNQASIPIVGTVHAGATVTSFVFSVTSGNSPVTSQAIDNRGCLFKSGALIGAYPNILSSVVNSANVVTINVCALPVAPSLNDVIQIV